MSMVNYQMPMIQDRIERLFPNHRYRLRNVRIFNWESDMFSMEVDSGFTCEIEIKMSRSDYFADFKKPKHKVIGSYSSAVAPNFFYFACPDGLILPMDLPPYAGLIYFDTETRKAWIHQRCEQITWYDHFNTFNQDLRIPILEAIHQRCLKLENIVRRGQLAMTEATLQQLKNEHEVL
jgi:hypothetical protein